MGGGKSILIKAVHKATLLRYLIHTSLQFAFNNEFKALDLGCVEAERLYQFEILTCKAIRTGFRVSRVSILLYYSIKTVIIA